MTLSGIGQIPKFLTGYPTTLSLQTPSNSIYGPPGQVIWQEDFEGAASHHYQTGQVGQVGTPDSTAYIVPAGWQTSDRDVGSLVMVTDRMAVRGRRCLWMKAPTVASGKCDISKIIALPATAKVVRVENWFALTSASENQSGNFIHTSIETWNDTQKTEAIVAYYPGSGQQFWGCGSTFGSLFQNARVLPFDSTTFDQGVWHYHSQIIDLAAGTVRQVVFDDLALTTIANQPLRTLSDTTFSGLRKPLRIEFGPVNGGTHNSPTDDWHYWVDDIVVSVIG